MSRHELVPLDETISCVVVGWNWIFASFFFQMYRADNDCPFDSPDDELGCDFRQVTTAEEIIDEVRKYAQIPASLSTQLNADAAREGSCEPPAAVRIMSGAGTNADWNSIPRGTDTEIDWDDVPIPF